MQHLRYVGVVLLITLLATYNVRTSPLEEEKLTYLEELIQRAIEGEQHNSEKFCIKSGMIFPIA